MKFSAALLVLATSALARQVRRADDPYHQPEVTQYEEPQPEYEKPEEKPVYEKPEPEYEHPEPEPEYEHPEPEYGTKTATTYTTLTTCPVTKTHTKEGTTYYVTELTTSTIVVTDCYNCEVTVKKPDVTHVETDVDYVTKTTICPVTETKTIDGKVVTQTYITTSVIYEAAHTTVYDEVKKPDVTKYDTDVVYNTHTKLYPVTETKYVDGKEVTVVYTKTELVEEAVKTTVYDHVKKPDVTKTDVDVVYQTQTKLYPVTETKYVDGKEVTVTYTKTEIVEEAVKTTVYDKIQKPDVTKTDVDVVYTTRTSVYPVTETKYVDGKEVTVTYTSTSVVEEVVKTTVYDKVQKPDVTKTGVDVHYETKINLIPVTETKYIDGKEVTVIHTETEHVVKEVETTVYDHVKKPDVTKTEVDVHYQTKYNLIPVTETKTVEGEVVTVVHTETEYVVKEVETTIPVEKTIYKTVGDKVVHTEFSKVYVTVGGGTVVHTVLPKPETVQQPETETIVAPVVTQTEEAPAPPPTPTEAPVEVPSGAAASNKAPAVALVAGVVGIFALF